MKPTVTFVSDSFARFNDLYFGGILVPLKIVLTNARTFVGKLTYVQRPSLFGLHMQRENYTMKISTAFDLPENELEDVIIHEMIHYYIASCNIKDTSAHGTVFRSMMNGINAEYGRNITVRHHSKAGELTQPKTKIRDNLLCVTQLCDDNWGITSCAMSRVLEIDKKLPKYYHLKSKEWYSSVDPFFNRYPRSITPKIYKITRTELDEHLSDAVKLELDS